MPSGENQLSFEEGDRIALVGAKAKGWQFGENLRTQHFGWFPVAYTNAESLDLVPPSSGGRRYENMHMSYERSGNNSALRSYHDQQQQQHQQQYEAQLELLENDTSYRRRRNHSAEESSPTRMFGDTIKQHQRKIRSGANPRPGPPPTLPAPVPNGQNQVQSQSSRMLNSSQSFCATNGVPAAVERRKQKLLNGAQVRSIELSKSLPALIPFLIIDSIALKVVGSGGQDFAAQ